MSNQRGPDGYPLYSELAPDNSTIHPRMFKRGLIPEKPMSEAVKKMLEKDSPYYKAYRMRDPVFKDIDFKQWDYKGCGPGYY